MNQKLTLFMSILLILGLSSCNNNKDSSSNNSSTSSFISSTSSSSSKEETIDPNLTLLDAIERTTNYGVTSPVRQGGGWYYEINTDTMKYYDPRGFGHVIIDQDPDYVHAFSNHYTSDGQELLVHGRRGIKEQFNLFEDSSIMRVLKAYANYFKKVDATKFSCNLQSLGQDLETYFQASSYEYTNYFEIILSNDGRISKLLTYERTGTYYTQPTSEILIEHINNEDYLPYKEWKENGSKIDLLIYDLKYGYFNETGTEYYATYQNEEVEISGTVVAIDENKDVYIANKDNINGNVSIRVNLKNSTNLPNVNDIINVKGTIKLNNYVPYLEEAQYTATNEVNKFLPMFDEEAIVDQNGGGVYAVNFFSQAPYFADSLYSTFAYVESIPEKNIEGQDTIIELVCPFFSSIDGDMYHMRLIIPKNLSNEIRDEKLAELKQFGIFNLENNTAKEISLQNVILGFDMNYDYIVTLKVINTTIISKRLNAQEKIEALTGLTNFPIINSSSVSCYRFGGSTGMFIESNYGSTKEEANGVYLYTSTTIDEINEYLQALKDFGFETYNIIRDANTAKHTILKYNDIFIDYMCQESMGDGYMFLMWVYQGEFIHGELLNDILEDTVGDFFPIEDFIKLSSTHDADYSYFPLINYAGHDFTLENPLHCFTLDVNEDIYEELRLAYINSGYKTYRNSDNTMYTYNTRGVNHYIYYKNVEGTNLKNFIDLAIYPTEDYTFSGHGEFKYRIEILIYHAETPLSTNYETNLDTFINAVAETNEDFKFTVSLPEDSKIEFIKKLGSNYLTYGYHYQAEAYIYSKDFAVVYDNLINGLVEAGYTKMRDGNRSVTYTKEGKGWDSAYITIMRNDDRQFVRVLNSIGGIDF